MALIRDTEEERLARIENLLTRVMEHHAYVVMVERWLLAKAAAARAKLVVSRSQKRNANRKRRSHSSAVRNRRSKGRTRSS